MKILRIGDTLAPASSRDIFAPGQKRWHALFTFPQREHAARGWLSQRGVYSFYPVRSESRIVRGKGINREVRYLPGYLFAEFPGQPLWHKILAGPIWDNPFFVRDVLRMHSGQPGWLHEDTLTALMAMRSTEDSLAEQWRSARTLRRGNNARILDGHGQGQVVEVVELRVVRGTTLAKFRVKMFGGEFDTEIDVRRLEKIDEA